MQTTSRNAEYNRLMEAGRERAKALRKQAINDAWSDAGDAALAVYRSAVRFVRSLQRHESVRTRQMEA